MLKSMSGLEEEELEYKGRDDLIQRLSVGLPLMVQGKESLKILKKDLLLLTQQQCKLVREGASSNAIAKIYEEVLFLGTWNHKLSIIIGDLRIKVKLGQLLKPNNNRTLPERPAIRYTVVGDWVPQERRKAPSIETEQNYCCMLNDLSDLDRRFSEIEAKDHLSIEKWYKEPVSSENSPQTALSPELPRNTSLHIIIDLDNTLIHTVDLVDLNSDFPQSSIIDYSSSIKIVLRPGIYQFLQTLLLFSELSVFTHGQKLYARKALKLIDPEWKYFKRLLAPSEKVSSFCKKTIENFEKSFDFTVDKNSLLIIDDQILIWDDSEFSVPIKPFIGSSIEKEASKYHIYQNKSLSPKYKADYLSTSNDTQLKDLTIAIFAAYKIFLQSSGTIPIIKAFSIYRSSLLADFSFSLEGIRDDWDRQVFSYLATSLGASVASGGHPLTDSPELTRFTTSWLIHYFFHLREPEAN